VKRLALLLLCWVVAVWAGDFTMPGSRGRIRPPVPILEPLTALPHQSPDLAAVYLAGMFSNAGGTYTSITLLANRLYALPFMAGTTATFDQASAGGFTNCGTLFPLAFITGAAVAAMSCKLAVYDSIAGMRHPDHVLFQSGDLAVSTSATEVGAIPPPSLVLRRGTLYWFVLWCNGAASIRAFPTAMSWPFAGGNGSVTDIAGNSYRATSTYAASFPDPFPSGCATCAVVNLSSLPGIQACLL